jgi:hypothetical protein
MDDSILNSTKKILGIGPDYTAFDLDILTHINAALSIASQLGVVIDPDFIVEDEMAGWSDLELPQDQTNLLRTYIFLKVRMIFDPPTTSFLIDATNKQIGEYESRLNLLADASIVVEEGGVH